MHIKLELSDVIAKAARVTNELERTRADLIGRKPADEHAARIALDTLDSSLDREMERIVGLRATLGLEKGATQ